MTVDEVKGAKARLETTIRDAIHSFEADTGTRVESVRLDRFHQMGGPDRVEVEVQVP